MLKPIQHLTFWTDWVRSRIESGMTGFKNFGQECYLLVYLKE
jgi:hypothetical protein